MDPLVLTLAQDLSKITRITGTSLCYWSNQLSFWDAWREPDTQRGWSLTVRMGRLDFIADWRGTGKH